MSKITISRNCANGEHVFIPANTYIDGREHIVINWVCQNCLMLVNDKEWFAHLAKHYPSVEEAPKEEPEKEWTAQVVLTKKEESKPEPKLPYPGRKRGPKPKQMDIPGTSK